MLRVTAADLTNLQRDVFRVVLDPQRQIEGAGGAEIERALARRRQQRRLQAVHAAHGIERPAGQFVLLWAPADLRPMADRDDRNQSLLQRIAAMNEIHRAVTDIERRGRLRKHQLQPFVTTVVPQVDQRHTDLALVVGRELRHHTPPHRNRLAAVRLNSFDAVSEQEAVVGGEDELIDARFAQQPPGGLDVLHRVFENQRPQVLFARLVDLLAMHENQPGLGDHPLQAFRITLHHLAER